MVADKLFCEFLVAGTYCINYFRFLLFGKVYQIIEYWQIFLLERLAFTFCFTDGVSLIRNKILYKN
jgi:hypothetical protein